MVCASCKRSNRAGARFCAGCGGSLAARCPACGAETAPDAQFCDACGASLAAATPAGGDSAGSRKVVTILFADLVGSTSLQERLDAESTRRVMERYYAAMRGPVEAHGGTVVQLLGDGVMCAFGVPNVAEDDAIRAVRAAVAMQQAFREFAREEGAIVGDLGLRIAVNTGEVVTSDERPQGIGDPLNVAGRLQQEAREGDVLLGEATRRLVSEQVTLAHFGTFALKGRAEPVPAYRVVSLERPAGAPAIGFVGRDEELRRLTSVYEAAVAEPGPRLAAILGSPGLGKSRLLGEFARRLGERAIVLTARCDPAGGSTFAPLAEALRGALRIDDGASGEALRAAIESALPAAEPERARIAAGVAGLLAGAPASPEETFFVVRRLLATLAQAQPVVLALDDLQWAEPLLLDLTEHLVQWSSGVPLLVLVAARPELRDARSSLAAPSGLVADVVTLAGLDAGAATRLAANVIGADELPAAIAGRVLATSEGNPLFVGELVRMLVHDGALKREGDRWTTSIALADIEMPPTIHALLAARIERLRPEERTILERAAVIGRQFSRAALAQLLPREIGDLDARLESLRRSELVEPDTGWFLGEPALRFHHALIRDAAYRRVLRGTRAELHGRFADWIAARVGDAIDHDETIGWHLEQAHQQLRELGPIDAKGRALGERAARYLAAAGRRALERDDVPVAGSLLGRALARLDPADPARADLALDWCEALLAAGEVGPAAGALAELARFAGDSDRLRAWHTCFAGQLAVLTDPQSLRATADAVEAAAEVLATAGDTAGEAKAHLVHALALQRLGKGGACEAALDRALAAARRVSGHRRLANTVLAGAPLAALWGPSPVTRASGRCLDVVRVLRITQGAPAVEAVALRCQALLEALRGRGDAARRMIASSRRMVEELGLSQQLLETDVFSGHIDLLEGDAVSAERVLRGAYDGLREHGLGIDAARAAALLARALLAQGRAAEAETLSGESEALAGDDLQAAIAWRGVRAEALARRGEPALAVEFARAAVEIAAGTDALLHHADARLALATALRAEGRGAEADTEERRAIELWEAKGATMPAERARRSVAAEVRGSTAGTHPPPSLARLGPKVRANAATAHAARLDAIVKARDADALAQLLSDSVEIVHHPTRTELGFEGGVSMLEGLLRAEDLSFRNEPLATLGESLVLSYVHSSLTALGGDDVAPFGAIDYDLIAVMEVNDAGRQRRAELFAVDRLGDAIARLYQLHGELLPDGPERARGAATARVLEMQLGPFEPRRWADTVSPRIDFVDHRPVGLGTTRGSRAFLRGIQSLLTVARDVTNRVDEILGARSDALLLRITNLGTDRASGGPYERPFFALRIFGADGLVSRLEFFGSDCADEARARFEELTAPAPVPRRRVRPNAATANAARTEAAVAARDFDALRNLFADDAQAIHHPTGRTYQEQQALLAMLQAADLSLVNEPLATLGESLALCRTSLSFSEIVGEDVPFGATSNDWLILMEVDGAGRRRHSELFATDRLGDALERLCARHAELLPDGAERARAAATARSVAALPLDGPLDLDRYGTAFSADVEWIDHRTVGVGPVRGAGAVVRGIRSLLDLTTELVTRADDVLGLCSEALLVRHANFGADRAGGGAFERHLVMLWVFGGDGLVTRFEQFDADHENEALARFDERVADRRSSQRRVRPNAATANAARMDAAFASRSLDAFRSLFRDDAHSVHHPTGVRYEESQALENYRTLLQAEGVALRHETLATLGDSLALFQASLSFDSYVQSDLGSVGAADSDAVVLTEVDAAGLRRLTEFFAIDRLGDAVVRMYERYAETLPRGPARERAAVSARVATALLDPFGADYSTVLAPDLVFADHRPLGLGSLSGAQEFVRWSRSLVEMSEHLSIHYDEVLGLRPDTLLVSSVVKGRIRAGGGSFEYPIVHLLRANADGKATRVEWFEPGQMEEALASFDELTAEPGQVERRVRPNAATANAARLEAVIAARDVDALPALLADGMAVVNHAVGVEHGREGVLFSLRSLLNDRGTEFRNEPLATLGDSIALCRWSVSGSSAEYVLDAGAWDRAQLFLFEVDAQGRRGRTEVFAADRLGDAIIRLYERYAELPPDGPGRTRAAETARSVATLGGLLTPERVAAAIDPAVELLDHRAAGFGALRGAQEVARAIATAFEVGEGLAERCHDVLAAEPDALLVSWVTSGRMRDGGGEFEWPHLRLCIAGSDGRFTRIETFGADKVGEALARFEELSGKRTAPLIENLATRAAAAGTAAMNARDWDRFTAPYRPGFRSSDRRRMVQLELDRSEFLELMRAVFEIGQKTALETLATRGSRLALFHLSWLAANGSVGPSDGEFLMILEVDDAGGTTGSVAFDPGDVDAAYAEVDRRFAAGEAAPYAETWEQFWRRSRAVDTRDWDQLAALLPPDLIIEDHRTIRWGVLHSRDEYLALFRALGDLAPDATARLEHVLGLDARGVLAVLRRSGSREGGAFEIPVVTVDELAPDGRVRRLHLYDLEQLDEARACYAALLRPSSVPRFENAATRWADRFRDALEAHDLERLTALHTPNFKGSDRRALMRLDQDRNQAIQSLERLLELRSPRCTWQLIATRGERLALVQALFEFSQDLGGPSEIEWLTIVEVDDAGQRVAGITFDSDALDAAYEELDDRYAAGEAASYARIWEQTRHRGRVHESRDWEQIASLYAPDLVMEDHRPVGWGTLSRDAYMAMRRSLVELAPDVALRLEHVLALDERGGMLVIRWTGTRAGGPFEIPIVMVTAIDAGRWVRGLHVFNLEQLAEARACYDALRNEPPTPRLENLATRASAVVVAAVQARDWDRFAAVLQPGFRNSDRRRMVQLELDRPQYLESLRLMFEMSRNTEIEVLATRGNRLALFHQSWLASDDDVGPSGGEFLMIVETDDQSGVVGNVLFDADAADAAYAELERRFTLLGARAPRDPLAALAKPTLATAAMDRMHAAFEARDWGALRSACAATARLEDRRSHVLVSLEVEPWMADMREVFTSPDTRIERRLASTAGEHIAIERCISRGGAVESAQGPFEIESLWLFEVDAQGLIVSVVLFEPDDWRAAEREAWTRWLARDTAAAAVHQPIFEMLEAMNARDRARLRAVFAANVVMEDRLRAGPGRIEGVDGYLEWAWSGFDLAPDVQISAFSVARGPYGGVGVMRLRGTLPEGGSFETLRATVTIVERGLIVRLELFEIEDVDAALARFAELRPDPLRIPATLATRTSDRIPQTFGAGDWDGLAALCAPTMVWDDRRRRSLLVGDRDLFVANIRVVVSQGRRLSKTLLATAGDRLSLHHLHWAGASSDVADFETENLSITEVDAEGRVTVIISFDADDRRSASAELRERFGRSDGAPYMLSAAFLRALGDHDLAGCRAALPDAFRFHDHRRAGAGVLGADEYVAFLRALFEQSPDVQIEPLYYVAVEKHGFVSVAHSFGTLADGGPFESVFVQLVTPLGGELFDLESLERARARFEALRQ